jgi:hypothetical protein
MPQNRGRLIAARRAVEKKNRNKIEIAEVVIRTKIKFYLGESAFLPEQPHIRSPLLSSARDTHTHTHIQRQEEKKKRSRSLCRFC